MVCFFVTDEFCQQSSGIERDYLLFDQSRVVTVVRIQSSLSFDAR